MLLTHPSSLLHPSTGCFVNSVIIVTAYDSMPLDAVLHTVTETVSVAIFTEISLANVASQLVRRAPKGQVRAVIYSGHEAESPDEIKQLLAGQEELGYKAVHIEELKSRDIDQSALRGMVEPKTGDTACIMYT
ncbi:hypothetical protein BC938DRAFT_483578 [Jimgerdemannia flammicorona]|uniref:AMP-dependent synthetase/ligase domain-containing protein n=1 Tax=Jimgerdemannia flammicorona TaxID=994334 RepID=A0A433QBW7_9FUNG|nr:hypothetical protein BC938DRAFT_483578 [Jimgerdemannia flammicorona]